MISKSKVKTKSFLVMEQALANRLGSAFAQELQPALTEITKAVVAGYYQHAAGLANSLDVGTAVARNEKFIRLIGMNAVLYGATKFAHAKNTSFSKGVSKIDLLDKAVSTTARMMTENTNTQIRRKALQLIAEEEYRSKYSVYAEKADILDQITAPEPAPGPSTFSKDFAPSVVKGGKSMADLGASLHTSRLANWGFLTEARLFEQRFYRISEVLDERTCPICEEMDGKVFPVEQAYSRAEELLSVENPDDLKSIAPWPGQGQDNVDRISGLSTGELMQEGLSMPPFHGSCRGILEETTETVEIEVPVRPPEPEITDEQLTSPDAAIPDSIIDKLRKLLTGLFSASASWWKG